MDKKFSGSIIENFFRPFFGGIYLDKELGVSTKMFKFVFKMFAEGNATIPAKGIESIPQQLKSKLTKTQFRFNQRVKNITGKQIALQNGQILEADKIIVAANPHTMIRGLWNQKLDFNSVINLYFESNINFLEKPLIGLVPGKNNLINNFYFKNSLAGTDQSETNLLSVTIVGNQEIDDQLISEAIKEIRSLANQPGMKLKYVHGYRIPKALPQLIDLDYTVSPNTTKLTENIYLAGDYMLYPSLNAAMTSGRLAAEAVASTF
jgi:protoporphyrinogen oxidase